jgi:hypothetical protein
VLARSSLPSRSVPKEPSSSKMELRSPAPRHPESMPWTGLLPEMHFVPRSWFHCSKAAPTRMPSNAHVRPVRLRRRAPARNHHCQKGRRRRDPQLMNCLCSGYWTKFTVLGARKQVRPRRRAVPAVWDRVQAKKGRKVLGVATGRGMVPTVSFGTCTPPICPCHEQGKSRCESNIVV